MKCKIYGIGTDLGVHIDGERLGAKQLINDIKSFYKDEIIEIDQDEEIIKSKNLSDHRKNEYEINHLSETIYNKMNELYDKNTFKITIGGDKTSSLPSALSEINNNDNLGLIWIGATPSFSTFKETSNGNLENLILSSLTGYEKELATWNKKYYSEIKTCIVGLRKSDEKEKDNLKYTGIKVFTTDDIKDHGVSKVIYDALSISANKTKGVHIVYDLNIIDPTISPGVSIPIYNGINEEEAITINEELLKYKKYINSIDIVGFNPLRDKERKTEQIAVNLLAQIITEIEKNK